MREPEFSADFAAACASIVRRSAAPVTVAEVRRALRGTSFAFAARRDPEVQEILVRAAREGRLQLWPAASRRRQPRFAATAFAGLVAESLAEVLAEAPATPAECVRRVRKRLSRERGSHVEEEVRRQLRLLPAGGELLAIKAGRSTVILSRRWMARQAEPAEPLEGIVEAAVREIESAPGNYVMVSKLRGAAVLQDAVDVTILRLASAGRLVLAGYDGPWPIPGERQADVILDGPTRAYVAVARPREES